MIEKHNFLTTQRGAQTQTQSQPFLSYWPHISSKSRPQEKMSKEGQGQCRQQKPRGIRRYVVHQAWARDLNTYFQCGELGHQRRQCPQFLDRQIQQQCPQQQRGCGQDCKPQHQGQRDVHKKHQQEREKSLRMKHQHELILYEAHNSISCYNIYYFSNFPKLYIEKH